MKKHVGYKTYKNYKDMFMFLLRNIKKDQNK